MQPGLIESLNQHRWSDFSSVFFTGNFSSTSEFVTPLKDVDSRLRSAYMQFRSEGTESICLSHQHAFSKQKTIQLKTRLQRNQLVMMLRTTSGATLSRRTHFWAASVTTCSVILKCSPTVYHTLFYRA